MLRNVPGLLTCDNGAAFQQIKEALEECGYLVTYKVVNSRALTPQNRKRVYLVGIRDDLDTPSFEFPYVPDIGSRCGLHTQE